MKTYGLTHVALAVRDVKRSLEFYRQVLGVEPVYEEADSIQAQTPGPATSWYSSTTRNAPVRPEALRTSDFAWSNPWHSQVS